MTEVPKIVHQRLRVAGASLAVERDHPESDILNAFAEQALSQTEREKVLTHLALCADCRNVVIAALPQVIEPETAVATQVVALRTGVLENRRRSRLVWPSLLWAALAAGIAVAVFLARPRVENLRPAAHGTALPAQSQSIARLNSSQPLGGNGSFRDTESPHNDDAKATSKIPATREALESPSKRHVGMNARLASGAGEHSREIGKARRPLASEPSDLIAENGTVSPGGDAPIGHQMAPIVRAKPALDAAVGAAVTAQSRPGIRESGGSSPEILKESPQWKIEGGGLNRSLDGGRTWQVMLGTENSLLCYAAHGRQMWVGGQAGMLLHSVDGGINWTRMPVSREGQPLSSDITDINARDSTAILLITGKDGVWSTADGGKTWRIKPVQ